MDEGVCFSANYREVRIVEEILLAEYLAYRFFRIETVTVRAERREKVYSARTVTFTRVDGVV